MERALYFYLLYYLLIYYLQLYYLLSRRWSARLRAAPSICGRKLLLYYLLYYLRSRRWSARFTCGCEHNHTTYA